MAVTYLKRAAKTPASETETARKVVADIHARYFGAELDDRSLTPGEHPRLGAIHFEDWLTTRRK